MFNDKYSNKAYSLSINTFLIRYTFRNRRNLNKNIEKPISIHKKMSGSA